MQQRLATFELPSAELDDLGLEKEWNSFVDGLYALGRRPSDEAHHGTDTSVTFRLVETEHDELEHTLDFDLTKFGGVVR